MQKTCSRRPVYSSAFYFPTSFHFLHSLFQKLNSRMKNAEAKQTYNMVSDADIAIDNPMDQKPTCSGSSPIRDTPLPTQYQKYNHKVRRKSSKLSPIIVSVPSTDSCEAENHIRTLVENLKDSSPDIIREATCEIRNLAKDDNNKIIIASCGGIDPLVKLLYSADTRIQENAVTGLLNLSISDNNKIIIVNAEAIEPLIHVLRTGSSEARENSAATLSSISKFEEYKIRIGNCGAIGPLVELLGNGSPQGKKDAATALFSLSTITSNRAIIVKSGAINHLIDLMDPATGMVDRAITILANIATIPEGRTGIAQAGGIPRLIEAIELGSARGKENASAALWLFSSDSIKGNKYSRRLLEEGVGPPLVALSISGTARAKEKALKILTHLRNVQQIYGRRS